MSENNLQNNFVLAVSPEVLREILKDPDVRSSVEVEIHSRKQIKSVVKTAWLRDLLPRRASKIVDDMQYAFRDHSCPAALRFITLRPGRGDLNYPETAAVFKISLSDGEKVNIVKTASDIAGILSECPEQPPAAALDQ